MKIKNNLLKVVFASMFLAVSFIPLHADAAAVFIKRYPDGVSVYYDDSSIYWADETSFSVAVSEVWNSGRTSYGIMKFYNNGTWMVIYDGMNRPVEDVPMANEVFHAIVG